MANCPLKFGKTRIASADPCERENCAWWDLPSSECAVLSIAEVLRLLTPEPEKEKVSGIPGLDDAVA